MDYLEEIHDMTNKKSFWLTYFTKYNLEIPSPAPKTLDGWKQAYSHSRKVKDDVAKILNHMLEYQEITVSLLKDFNDYLTLFNDLGVDTDQWENVDEATNEFLDAVEAKEEMKVNQLYIHQLAEEKNELFYFELTLISSNDMPTFLPTTVYFELDESQMTKFLNYAYNHQLLV